MTRMITNLKVQEGNIITTRHLLPRKGERGYRNVIDEVTVFVGLDMADNEHANVYNFNDSLMKEVSIKVDPNGITIEFLDDNRKKTVATDHLDYGVLFDMALFAEEIR